MNRTDWDDFLAMELTIGAKNLEIAAKNISSLLPFPPDMYVCMYVCMHVCMYVHACVCVACMYACVYVRMHAHVCMHIVC